MAVSLSVKMRNTDETTKTVSIANANINVTATQVSQFVNMYNQLYDDDFSLISAVIAETTYTTIYPEA